MTYIRHDWTAEEISEIYHMPLLKLIQTASAIKQQHYPGNYVQFCHLVSIKTGGCPEDCKYCAQSSSYKTPVSPQPLMSEEELLQRAKQAVAAGATRICLAAGWRGLKEGVVLQRILSLIDVLKPLNVEICCSLGLINDQIAQKLAEAGVYAYNHNLDSSPEFYRTIITTRTYEQRLETLDAAERAGLSLCCGGIIGMGETALDRIKLLLQLANRTPHPESVPINLLHPIPGTPLENQSVLPIWDLLRMVAAARIVMPKAMIRLSAGREGRPFTEQALLFLAGANSIFTGGKLLTVDTFSFEEDESMLQLLGLVKHADKA